MSLEKIKEESDLQEQLNLKSKEYKRLGDQRNETLIKSVVSDFKSFFEKAGFSVVSQNSKLQATYKGTSIYLELPSPEDRLFGGIAKFVLGKDTQKPKLICVTEKGSTGFSITSRVVTFEEKKDPIIDLRDRLDKLDKSIAEFNTPKIEFRVVEIDDKSRVYDAEPYDSFLSACESYLK